ncbi:MAG TPA: OmpH family outer membrane protein [Blastocatellia bacterium]|nr:OmpH family outer membrane protein [Blastocatellia bacterium]
MKLFKSALATFALLALSSAAAAQQPAAPTQAAAPALLPQGKVAVINTNAFQEKIGEFRVKIEELNRQFEPRIKEIESLANRITALENTMKTQAGTLTPAKIAEMTEQVETMKREYQRKTEDLQADGNRARNQSFEPISQKLAKFAQDYTARKGIVLLIDLANALQSNTIVWYEQRTDVTQDFINEYNKAYPVPGAPQTSPAPANPTPKPAGQKP